MKAKKAIIYYGGFVSRAGGAYFHVVNIEKGLVGLGWQVDIVTLDSLPLVLKYLPHLFGRLTNLLFAPRGLLVKAWVTKILYSILYKKMDGDLLIFEDIYLSWHSKIPSITILHAVWSDNIQAFNLSQKRIDKLKDVEVKLINEIKHPLVTVSEPYRHFLITEHFSGQIEKHIDVIPLGLDQNKFVSKPPIERKNHSLIYTGALEARKNVEFLIAVLKRLTETDGSYILTIVGDGPDEKKLQNVAQRDGLAVKFLGRLSHEDVLQQLQAHEFYVHPSQKESFSFSLLEAKLCGLKTFALASLQVPQEFIDCPIEGFTVEKWSQAIIEGGGSEPFDSSPYTYQKMTESTLALAIKEGN